MRVLGGSEGFHGIRGHSLVRVLFLFCDPGLLGLLERVVRRGWDLSCTVLAYFGHPELEGTDARMAGG